MSRTEKEILHLYYENERLVNATIYRNFNSPNYRNAHGLSRDEIEQFGRIGLYNACRTYDESKGASFQNHAIRSIIGTILREAKINSLANINKSSNKLLDRVSMDISYTDESGEEFTMHDTLADTEHFYDNLESDNFIESVKSNISDRVAKIVDMRLEQYTFEEIATQLGVSRQAVEQQLSRNRDKIASLM